MVHSPFSRNSFCNHQHRSLFITHKFLARFIFFLCTFLFIQWNFRNYFSLTNRDQLDNWVWSLAFGIPTFVVGISLVSHPALSITVLVFYVGFLLLFRSISSISFAWDVKKYGNKNWGGLLVFGILGAIFSFILIWNPAFAGLSVVILVSLSFLFAGLFSIFLAFQLRRLHKSSKSLSGHLKERYDLLMEEIRKEQGNY